MSLSPQNIEALKAFHTKLAARRSAPRSPRRLLADGGVAIHSDTKGRTKQVRIKRAVFVDRSIYTGEILRAWVSINGVGKGLSRLAQKANGRG